MPVMGRHSGLLSEIFNHAQKMPGSRLRVAAVRGATRLSNGRVLTERAGIAKLRAEEVAELFQGAGLPGSTIEAVWRDEAEAADGVDDWRSRRVTVRVEP
jgi:CO/xanthine dehydrogenase FAD-binding subunit